MRRALRCAAPGVSFVLVQYLQFTYPGNALHTGVLCFAFLKINGMLGSLKLQALLYFQEQAISLVLVS